MYGALSSVSGSGKALSSLSRVGQDTPGSIVDREYLDGAGEHGDMWAYLYSSWAIMAAIISGLHQGPKQWSSPRQCLQVSNSPTGHSNALPATHAT